jgi:hypothetical protein
MEALVHVLGWEYLRLAFATGMQPKKFKCCKNVSLGAYRSIQHILGATRAHLELQTFIINQAVHQCKQ